MKYIIMLAVLLFPLISFADGAGECPIGMGGYGMMNSFGLGYFGGLLNFILWIAIVVGIVYVVRMLTSKKTNKEKDAMGILKERYAKGEIKKEEFEEMKKEIE